MNRPTGRRLLALGITVTTAALLAACSSAGATTSNNAGGVSGRATSATLGDLSGIPASSEAATATVDGNKYVYSLGNGKTISWTKGTKPQIAFFAIGSNNSWLAAQITAVKAEAAKIGAGVTVFDGAFDAATQQAQVQAALSSHKYNAFIVNPVDPKLECNLFVQQAPAQNIPVVDVTGPLCDRNGDNGAAAWAPGSFDFIGGHDLESFFQDDFMKVASLNTSAKVGFLTGPNLNGPSDNAVTAMNATLAKYPGFKIDATYRTDYTAAQGLTDTESLLQAHPDVQVIVSTYSGITDGVLGALARLHKTGKIKVYTIAGNDEDVKNLKSGAVAMSAPLYPVSMGDDAVTVIYRIAHGMSVPRYLGNDGHPIESIRAHGDSQLFLTKDNIAQFTPEYQ